MRSFLNVPLDPRSRSRSDCSPPVPAECLAWGADCLILERAATNKAHGNLEHALSFCKDLKHHSARQQVYLRLNAQASTGLDDELTSIATSELDGILLDHCESGRDVTAMDVRISTAEAIAGREIGSLDIIAQVTDTAAALFELGSYKDASPRLKALTWNAELIGKAIGAKAVRTGDGSFISPCQTARDLCLIGAVSAGIPAIDTAHPDHADTDAFRREAMMAERDGFQGKWATCTKQVAVIHEIFDPS